MRVQKARKNVSINLITYILGFLPVFIVRKVFLTTLGEELLGLSSLYTNIIGLLSIVELGIGTAIIFALYKPFADDNKIKIKGYIDYYAKFYRKVGITIFICGIAILPFLNIFIKNEINIHDAQIYFIIILLNTVISYFFLHKTSLLYVSQQVYKISILNTITKIIIAVIQIILLKMHFGFIEYLTSQLVINIIYYVLLNMYIDKEFSWIKDIEGYIEEEEKKSLTQNVKALFIHKLGGLIVLSTDNLLISSILSLSIVSKFNSYYLILSSAQSVVVNTISGVTASIGNLLTEDNKENAYKVHTRFFLLNFWIGSFVAISLLNTISQFIGIWLGESQLLDSLTIVILVINLYFMIMRSSVESFKEAGGLYYQDRYAALLEAAVNLISSIILVQYIGLAGIFLGTFISNFTVVFWIKPKIVYKYIFDKPLKSYFVIYFKYLFLSIIPLVITFILTYKIKQYYTIMAFVANCAINIVVINVSYILIFMRNEEFLYYKNIILNMVKRNKN